MRRFIKEYLYNNLFMKCLWKNINIIYSWNVSWKNINIIIYSWKNINIIIYSWNVYERILI